MRPLVKRRRGPPAPKTNARRGPSPSPGSWLTDFGDGAGLIAAAQGADNKLETRRSVSEVGNSRKLRSLLPAGSAAATLRPREVHLLADQSPRRLGSATVRGSEPENVPWTATSPLRRVTECSAREA